MNEFAGLDKAINAESWEWLSDNLPDLAKAVKTAVDGGSGAIQIRRHVLIKTHRDRLAARCGQAAQHLVDEKRGEA